MATPDRSAAVRSAVDIFTTRLLADPAISHYWEGIDMARLRSHQKAFLISALGGQDLYSGRDMRAAHAELGIDAVDYERVFDHLLASMREVGISEDVVVGASRHLSGLRHQIVKG